MDDIIEDVLFIHIDVGTLAVIILVVVTTCSLVTFLAMYCWNRSSSHTRLTCSRCHQVVAVQGVPLPPQLDQPVVHPYRDAGNYTLGPGLHPAPVLPPPPTHPSAGRPSYRHSQQLPAIVINQPPDIDTGHSATFQRLGMKQPESGMSDDARTLETRALSQVQASPPEVTTPGLEPLTPSPVLAGNQDEQVRRGRRVTVQVYKEPVSCEQSASESKLQQVRMVNFPSFQTPCAKTPTNAYRHQRSSLRSTHPGKRSVTSLQPTKLYGQKKGSDQPLLDVSEMCRTVITTGDLNDLCEDPEIAETSLTSAVLTTPATISPCASITPTPSSTNTLTPGLPSDNLSKSLEKAQLRLMPDRKEDQSQHFHPSVNSRQEDLSPQLVIVNKDSPVTPYLAITEYERNVTDRRSLAGGATAPLPITSSDKFVTVRNQQQHSTSPGDVFFFSKNFDPGEPQPEYKHSPYVHPLADTKPADPTQPTSPITPEDDSYKESYTVLKRKSSLTLPSKIPINEGYLERGSSTKKISPGPTPPTPTLEKSSTKTPTPKHLTYNLDKNAGKATPPAKPSRPGLDRSSTGTPAARGLPPKFDRSGASGTKSKCETPGSDKSVSNSGTKPKILPPSYPDRPGTKIKSPPYL